MEFVRATVDLASVAALILLLAFGVAFLAPPVFSPFLSLLG